MTVLSYWYLTHPRLGRSAALLGVMYGLAVAAVCAAPLAGAAPNAVVLNWTGLRDTYGVPIGDYYLAIASVRDQIAAATPDVGWSPDTWAAGMAHVIGGIMASLAAANILTAEAGLFIGVLALALWLLKITVSTYWLAVVGEIARAMAGAVVQVTTAVGLLLVVVPVGVFAGVVTVKRGEAGRGATMIGIALMMPAASVAVFDDPAGLMYGPDGLLAFGRRVGFSVASAAIHNGALGATAGAGQVDTLTASLITHTAREPLQLWNFGHVVDRVGGCGAAWSAAVSRGVPDGPIRAMAGCGDRAAVTFAQHLDGTNIWVGLVLVAAAGLLGLFMVASGWAVLRVSVKAVWTTVILLPSLWLGAIPGAPQRRAVEVVWQFFRHGIEVLVYIVFVSVIGLAVERIVGAPLPAELGGTNPFAHVLLMGGIAVVALVLLRHIHADLSGRPPGTGLLRQATGVAVGMGMTAAFGAAGAAAAQGVRGLRRSSGSHTEMTPWERLESEANNARSVHGAPQSGFDPVPGDAPREGALADGRSAEASVDDRGGAWAPVATAQHPAGVRPAREEDAPAVAAMIDGPASGVESGRSRARPEPQPDLPAPAVPAILETGFSGPVPLPDPPVPDDEHPPPPTTVDPDR